MSTFIITNHFEDYSYKNSFGLTPMGVFLCHDYYYKHSGFMRIEEKSGDSFMGLDLIGLIDTGRVHTFFMDEFDGLVSEATITQKMNTLRKQTITTANTSTELEYGVVYSISLGKTGNRKG